jgi:hypothetical protein
MPFFAGFMLVRAVIELGGWRYGFALTFGGRSRRWSELAFEP